MEADQRTVAFWFPVSSCIHREDEGLPGPVPKWEMSFLPSWALRSGLKSLTDVLVDTRQQCLSRQLQQELSFVGGSKVAELQVLHLR